MPVKITYGSKQPAPPPDPEVEDDEDLETWRKNMKHVLPVLKEAGVFKATITFSGEGDSGSVDDAVLDSEWDHPALKLPCISASIKSVYSVSTGKWTEVKEGSTSTVKQVLHDIAEDWAESTGVDWYNNDGGHGSVTLNVIEGTFEADINQYEQVSHNVKSEEGEI